MYQCGIFFGTGTHMSDSILLAKTMTMGLIEHSANFFNVDHLNEVRLLGCA